MVELRKWLWLRLTENINCWNTLKSDALHSHPSLRPPHYDFPLYYIKYTPLCACILNVSLGHAFVQVFLGNYTALCSQSQRFWGDVLSTTFIKNHIPLQWRFAASADEQCSPLQTQFLNDQDVLPPPQGLFLHQELHFWFLVPPVKIQIKFLVPWEQHLTETLYVGLSNNVSPVCMLLMKITVTGQGLYNLGLFDWQFYFKNCDFIPTLFQMPW